MRIQSSEQGQPMLTPKHVVANVQARRNPAPLAPGS